MRNWFARWFGADSASSADRADAAAVAAVATTARAPASTMPAPAEPASPDTHTAYLQVSRAFYQALAGSAGAAAPPATERLILDELAGLAATPARAADLVPRVPAVVPELLRGLRDERVSSAAIARLLAQDMVLVAEVVREANSAFYRPPAPVRNIEGAVRLLGQNGLRMLLARVAFRPVISVQSGRFARMLAPRIWAQSEHCAQAAAALAPAAGLNPFEAYLAGLIQNVGLIVALRLIDQVYDDDVLPRSDAFCTALLRQARELAAGIAHAWEFPPAVVEALVLADQPHAGALAGVLATAEALASLHVLHELGALRSDDALTALVLTPRLRPVYDSLARQEA
jgi:HD-like signal output (HDOD) protein